MRLSERLSATQVRAEHLDECVDENTICVVAIAGQTFTGEDEDAATPPELHKHSGAHKC